MTKGRLPNLLIVGVPKAGTTSLFGFLAQHPDVCASTVKEIGYFSSLDPRGRRGTTPSLEWYAQHFAHCTGERYAMEATPSYCYGGAPVIDAIRGTLRSPRIVLILRNPTDRLWSAYTFQRSKGNFEGFDTFDAYVDTALRHYEAGTHRSPGRRMQGVATGFYADYLPRWIEAFGSDLHVTFAESLAANPRQVLSQLFAWLEITDETPPALNLDNRNVTVHPRSTGIARLVYQIKRGGDRLGLLPPPIRARLRSAYLRLNTGRPPERLTSSMRNRLDDLYHDSNRRTARALAAHGVAELPNWLLVSRDQ